MSCRMRCRLQIAKWLGAPVVLVIDCWAMARSAAALVKGYAEFDPGAPLIHHLFCNVLSTANLVYRVGDAWHAEESLSLAEQ